MKKGFKILIADRNPHVRDFLKRELTAEGYKVMLAKNGREVLSRVKDAQGLDLLVVDIDLPYAGGSAMLKEIRDRIPSLPVVVHTLLPEYVNHPVISSTVAFVEKEGNSVDRLKDVIFKTLRKPPSGLPFTA